MKEKIFWGFPGEKKQLICDKMSKGKLLEIIEYLAGNNRSLEKQLHQQEDTTIQLMDDCIKLKESK